MSYDELRKTRMEIIELYFEKYAKLGFNIEQALSLNNPQDITIDFTTCTICKAKQYISSRTMHNDYVMIQPCLRNTHISIIGNLKQKNNFFSFFTMIGGFKYYKDDNICDDFDKIIKTEFDFLSAYAKKVVLTIPIQYVDFIPISKKCIEYLHSKHCTIIYSTNDTENLKWKYGLQNVEGFGTRWEISNGVDLVNYGNTINLLADKKPFGVDFGGGLESLIYANKGLKSALYANVIMTDLNKEFCSKNSLNEKILDCIVSAMCILANKEQIILRDAYILNIYMRLLHSLSIVQNISREEILEIVNVINEIGQRELHNDNMINKFLYYYDIAIKNFEILTEDKNIDKIMKLVELCYNELDSNWMQHKKILTSHVHKYFINLTEIDLFALIKERKEIKNEKAKKITKR